MSIKKTTLLFSLLLIAMLLVGNVSADTGTTIYQFHIESRGQVSSGANWKHTTSAIARDDYGSGFFLATKTYLEYSGIPDWTLGTSYVYQLKENVSWQNHYHSSMSGWTSK